MAGEPTLSPRERWIAALLLGSVATPAAVILAVPAPVPLDAILAWPLVLMDRLMPAREPEPLLRVAAIAVGITLTWAHYVLLARLLVGRVAAR